MKTIVSIVVSAAMIAAGSAVYAKSHQDHDDQGDQGDRYEHGSHASHHEHHDNGKHLAKGHYKFDHNDHEITRRWCEEHRENLPVGFRPVDRLAPELEAHLHVGGVLDVTLRSHMLPVPTDLVRLLPPPPPDLRYMAIGGHVALLDATHRVHDLLPVSPMPF